jgi:hypothetical protein
MPGSTRTMPTRLKTRMREWLGFRDWQSTVPAFFALLALAVLLQWLGGAYRSEFGGHPDEPAHYVTGLMVRDYLATAAGQHPMAFAEDYYDHYPKVALGNWPPVFYALQAAWTLPFSPARGSVIGLMALLSALTAWLIFLAVRTDFGPRMAFLVGALFLCLPLVQEHTASIMTEIPIALFAWLAALCFGRYLDREHPFDAACFGLCAALAILTKGSALSLAPAAALAVLFTGRFHLLSKAAFWLPVPIVLLLAGPWTWKFREQAKAGWVEQSPAWSFTREAIEYYPRKLVLSVGIVLFVLAIIGLFACWRRRRTDPHAGRWAMAAGLLFSVVLVHFVVPCGYEPRHLLPALPALMVFVVAGLDCLITAWSVRVLARGQAAALATLLALVPFFGGTFRLYEKGCEGFGVVAETVLADVAAPSGRVLISSDATGEGIFIAEIALREQRPGSTIRRASKVLARSSWSGAGYQAKFETENELLAALAADDIRWIITDASMPPDKRVPHHVQLIAALAAHPDRYELAGTYPMTRGGVRQDGALRVYRRR